MRFYICFERFAVAVRNSDSTTAVPDLGNYVSNVRTATDMSAKQDPELAKNDLHVTNSASSASIPVEGETHHLPTFEHERALTWKFDLRMLPMLAVCLL